MSENIPQPQTTAIPQPKTITLADLASAARGTSSELSPLSAADVQNAKDPGAAQTLTFTPEEQRQIAEKAASIDFMKNGIESSYARDSQMSMSDFSDGVLAKTRNQDTGEAGQLLSELLVTVDKADLSGVQNIPIVGRVVMSIDKLRRHYQKVAPQIDEIVGKLETCQARMVSDIAMLDTLYTKDVAQYRQLKIDVAAGRKALADFRATQLPALEEQAKSSSDPMEAQVLSDFKAKLERFDKRLDDLDRVSVVSLQMAPQIKILQSADRTVSDKIDTTISTTIPLWKSQMLIALGLANQRKALDLQHEVDETTNKLLRANAAALHQSAVDAEKANQRAVVDVETLQQVNDQLIATLKDTLQIQKEGRAARDQAQVQMRKIEGDLKQALLESAQSMD